jgi:ribosomal protein L19E
MFMSVQMVRRTAARLLGCGESRVVIADAKRAEEALTSDDVRALIHQGVVWKRLSVSPGRAKAENRQKRRRMGRGRGPGAFRGGPNARQPGKERWMARVRKQRRLLQHFKPLLPEGAYRSVYRMIKGNAFRDAAHLQAYLRGQGYVKAKG